MMSAHPPAATLLPGLCPADDFRLRLYIAGTTPRSTRAVVNLRKLCELHLKGRYQMEVIDLLENPGRAREDQIIAAPTLIRRSPLPERRFVGDLSDTSRVMAALTGDAGLPSV